MRIPDVEHRCAKCLRNMPPDLFRHFGLNTSGGVQSNGRLQYQYANAIQFSTGYLHLMAKAQTKNVPW